MFCRMPGQRLSIRINAALGRFHGENPISIVRKECECRHRFQRDCLCLYRRQSNPYDVSGDVDGVAPGDVEKERPTPPTLNGDTELDGEELGLRMRFETSFHTLQLKFLKLSFSSLSLSFSSELTLAVRSVDLLSEKSDRNKTEHHTDQYNSDQLIIRRGQTFQIELDLSRPFNPNTDKLHLEMKTGEHEVKSQELYGQISGMYTFSAVKSSRKLV